MAQPQLSGSPHHEPPEDRRSGVTFVKRARRMLPRPKARIDAARRVLVPLVLALVPLWWVCDATYRASLVTIGRDQGIFQYIAWAVRNGDVDYRDVRDVNGPLIHLVHYVLMDWGGHEEHRFQVLHLLITSITFAIAGACLAGFVRSKRPTW